ncbi:MAG: MFS transporter [Alphaproteobacteria bacterium]
MSRAFPLAAFLPMFATLCLMFGLGQAQRSGGSVISAALSAEMGLAGAKLGAVMAAMFFGAALAQIPVGVLLDRYGPRRVLPPFTLVGAAGCVFFAFADAPWLLGVGRALIGIGFSAAWAGAFIIASRWVSSERFTATTSAVAVTGAVASLLATAPLAWALATLGRNGTFLALAAATVLFAILSALVVRDAPPGAAPAQTNKVESLADSLRGLGDVLRLAALPRMAPVAFILFTPMMVLIGAWGGPFLRDVYGFDANARGEVLFLMMAAVTAGLLVYGRLERLANSRKWVVIGGAAGIAVCLGTLAALPSPGPWRATALLVGASFFGPLYVVFLAHCRALFPMHLMGRAMTMISLIGVMGIVTLQFGFGVILEFFTDADGRAAATGYRIGFAFHATIILIVLAFYMRVDDAPPRPRAADETNA